MTKKTTDGGPAGRKPAARGRMRPSPTRRTGPSLFRVFAPVMIFGAGMLWVAADKGHGPWAVAVLALGLGLLLAALAPRHKTLLGSLPALGIFAIFLIMEAEGGWPALRAVADFWAPVSVGAIIGSLVGARLRLRL